ncbi:MAG: hypothetical protein J6R01_08210 [Alistipes sp.]|nr:hypothetical protein [Alistipes sp.]
MTYQWKSTSRIKTNAQTAGEVCEALEKTVGLTAKTLLEASRPEDAPLHNEFEWNDSIAAEKYREDQARYIIRMLCVASEEEDTPPVRAFFTVSPELPYENIQRIVSNPEKRTSLLEMAFAEFKAFEAKYNAVSEFAPVFTAFQPIRVAMESAPNAMMQAM